MPVKDLTQFPLRLSTHEPLHAAYIGWGRALHRLLTIRLVPGGTLSVRVAEGGPSLRQRAAWSQFCDQFTSRILANLED